MAARAPSGGHFSDFLELRGWVSAAIAVAVLTLHTHVECLKLALGMEFVDGSMVAFLQSGIAVGLLA